jgi:hypothetical protein
VSLLNDAILSLCGLTAFVIALYGVGRAMRTDNARRFEQYTNKLEKRVSALEDKLNLSERRRYQLEAILRAAGLPITPWPDPEFDAAEPGTVLVHHSRSLP